MSQRTVQKLRTCNTCKQELLATAAELKKHATSCVVEEAK